MTSLKLASAFDFKEKDLILGTDQDREDSGVDVNHSRGDKEKDKESHHGKHLILSNNTHLFFPVLQPLSLRISNKEQFKILVGCCPYLESLENIAKDEHNDFERIAQGIRSPYLKLRSLSTKCSKTLPDIRPLFPLIHPCRVG